jgi:hypothetical protein
VLSHWFDRKPKEQPIARPATPVGPKVPRHSGGWAALRKRLETEPALRLIDVGYTSPANINYLTSLGHSIFLSDLVHDACAQSWLTGTDSEGEQVWNVDGFLQQSLNFAGRTFDLVLLWTALDYLPEAFVAPVVSHLYEAMNPGGQVLAFFHTRTSGEEAVHCRFHITSGDDVDVQLAEPFPIQRAFTNRSIERLFAAWSSHRQFLAKDSVSEVIITK